MGELSGRIRRAAVLVLVAIMAAGACGLGDRERLAREIEAGPAKAGGAVAAGTLGIGYTIDLDELPEQARDRMRTQAADATGDPLETVEVVVDLAKRRGVYLRDGKVVVFHDDQVVYGLRSDAAPDDARPWLKLDLADIDDGEAPLNPAKDGPFAGVMLLNPALLLDFTAGPLTGSIERRAEDRTYEANFDIEKVFTQVRRKTYPEERLEVVNDVLEVTAVDGLVHHGKVSLDGEGRPTVFRIELKRSDDYGVRVNLVLILTLDKWDVPFDIARPGDDSLLQLDGFRQFLRGIQPKQPAGAPAAGAAITATTTTAVEAQP